MQIGEDKCAFRRPEGRAGASSSRLSPFTSANICSVDTHGILDQRFFSLVQNILLRLARHHFLGDLKQRRHGQRRDALQPPRDDPVLDSLQHA